MKHIKHPFHTRTIGEPRDWNEEDLGECLSISVADVPAMEDDIHSPNVMNTLWRPDPEELMILNAGGAIELGVFGVHHPVIRLRTVIMTEGSA